MKDLMGIINLHEQEKWLKPLTNHRSLAAVPFGGRYRLIDFVLSNMVNSDIGNVGVLVPYNYRALMDHVRSGKEWDLARKFGGMFILPPLMHPGGAAVKGDMDHLHGHLDYLVKSPQQYVVISGSRMVCNLNYRKMFYQHLESGADVTVVYKEMSQENEELRYGTLLQLGDGDRITDMRVNADRFISKNLSMEMYFIKKELLIDIVDGCVSRGVCDFVVDGLIRNLNSLNVQGCRHDGYLAKIDSLASYFRHHMELLQPAVWEELFFKHGLIHTKVKDEAPAKYKGQADVRNSIVANGSIIEGTVENSIIFRGVTIGKGAYIKDSIVMQKGEIASGVVLENVICDKDVVITSDKRLKGERQYPLVIEKRKVI